MEALTLTKIPVMSTGMLIRKPAAVVFEAVVDPKVTTNFWFTKSSGKLEQGKTVQWEWEMYNVSFPVSVRTVEPNERVVVEWPGRDSPTTIEWVFTSLKHGTFVSITHSGFTGDGDALVSHVADSTQGFSLMLAGMKAWLEHGIRLNVVGDRYPEKAKT